MQLTSSPFTSHAMSTMVPSELHTITRLPSLLRPRLQMAVGGVGHNVAGCSVVG